MCPHEKKKPPMLKLKKPVKGIFFDLGWTLLAPPSGDWMFPSLAKQYFSPEKLRALPKERVDAALAKGTAFLDAHHLLNSMEEEVAQFLAYYTMLAKALPELGITETALQKITEDKVQNWEGGFRLLPGAKEALEALKGRYRLGVISDTWPSIVPVLEHFGLSAYFDCFTFSYSLGVFKPHLKMYEDALQKMGLPPEQTVFVDDSLENLEGARKAGIQPVLIHWKPNSGPREGVACISEPMELLKLLG